MHSCHDRWARATSFNIIDDDLALGGLFVIFAIERADAHLGRAPIGFFLDATLVCTALWFWRRGTLFLIAGSSLLRAKVVLLCRQPFGASGGLDSRRRLLLLILLQLFRVGAT